MVTMDDSEIINNSVNNNLYFSDEFRIEQYKASANKQNKNLIELCHHAQVFVTWVKVVDGFYLTLHNALFKNKIKLQKYSNVFGTLAVCTATCWW